MTFSDDADDDIDDKLDEIIWQAHKLGLAGLTIEQIDYLETYLWENGNEDFIGFDYEAVTYPEFAVRDIWMIEDRLSRARLEKLDRGASLSKREISLLKKAWLKNLKDRPDDDVVPGSWTDTLTASDGTSIKTIRLCYGGGWETDRRLIKIKAV